MSLTVVDHPRRDDKATMLENLETLRKQIEDGTAVAFCAVSIDANDQCYATAAAAGHVTVLRQLGAVSHLMHCLHCGEV